MNIFFLDENPIKAAEYQINKHVVKMILESAQLLCTAHHILDTGVPYTNKVKFYKQTHTNHPCSIWVRKCKNNYIWLAEHALSLCNEYTFRYGKTHASFPTIEYCSLNPPNIPTIPSITTPPLCMPDIYKTDNYIQSYRNYYKFEKLTKIKNDWGIRNKPHWI